MPRGPADKNTFNYIVYEGQECVQFRTTGDYNLDVIVDKDAWDNYLSKYTFIPFCDLMRLNQRFCSKLKDI